MFWVITRSKQYAYCKQMMQQLMWDKQREFFHDYQVLMLGRCWLIVHPIIRLMNSVIGVPVLTTIHTCKLFKLQGITQVVRAQFSIKSNLLSASLASDRVGGESDVLLFGSLLLGEIINGCFMFCYLNTDLSVCYLNNK